MKLLCAGIVAHQVMQCLYVYIPFFIAANGHYFILGQTYVVLGRVKYSDGLAIISIDSFKRTKP